MLSKIGTKLYLALGLCVLLTLLSSAVGVYYFEVSGDLNHRFSRETFPGYEGAWQASAAVDRLIAHGEREFARAPSGQSDRGSGETTASLVEELRLALSRPGGLPGLSAQADLVLAAGWTVSDTMDGLDASVPALLDSLERAEQLSAELDRVPASSPDHAVVPLLRSGLHARDSISLDADWDAYSAHVSGGTLSDQIRQLAEGQAGVFAVRQSWLAEMEQLAVHSDDFRAASADLTGERDVLLVEVTRRSSTAVASSLASFDRGRVLLFTISVASVLAATMASWLWVGNMVVRRLSRLSVRMRSMAAGDLDTPVPEVGADEIGELAGALEIFRQQAIEVQRLNLVERLYGELRQAHEELEAMQVRLVAQEKLAALGEIVSGVAHEISNPLSFVKNFAEGSGELSEELFEMLDGYRSDIAEDDCTMLDEIHTELSESLDRVRVNGTRALTIVRRMQSLGVVGGDPAMTALHPVLRRSVKLGCDTFAAEWGDFTLEPEYRLSDDVGEVPIVSMDFNEAVVNVITNACYAMRVRAETGETGYVPQLVVGSQLCDGHVAVTVLDNGTGISDDALPRIFDPFFTTRDGALGAGLGLPLAADVARRGGGDLTVETEAGSWSRFTLTLPLSLPPGAVTELDERYDSDLSTVRTFGADA